MAAPNPNESDNMLQREDRNGDTTQTNGEETTQGCKLKKNKKLVALILILAIVCIVAPIIIVPCLSKHEGHIKETQVLANTETDDIEDKYLLDPDAKCKEPSCYECREHIPPNLQPMSCTEEDKNIQNGSCYLCGNHCLEVNDIISNMSFVCDGKHIEITCCLRQHMANLGGRCGGNGRYICDSEEVHSLFNKTTHEPICMCPDENQTAECEAPKAHTAICKCHHPALRFCSHRTIISCRDVLYGMNWERCNVTKDRSDVKYSCICENISEKNVDNYNVSMCSDIN